MITKKLQVPIPEDKGIHIKTTGLRREKYVYKHIRYYRNSDGKPRNQSRAIGKYDEATGKMYPNANYYEMYKIDPLQPEVTLLDYGYTYLIMEVSKSIGLTDSLRLAFGARTKDILTLASYMIKEGNAMDGIDDWLVRNYIPQYTRSLNSQATSKIFSEITAYEQAMFFKDWIDKIFDGGSVFYDVTSISSYSQQMPEVERGYNRDGDNLSQFNIGIFCDKASKLPLYYNRYNGSLTDKTNLSYVIANAESVGLRNVNMILDGGFWSVDCFNNLQKYCHMFTIGMPGHLKESERIMRVYGNGIENYENKLTTCHHIYCRQVNLEMHGTNGRALLYYDLYNHTNLCDELSERIDTLKLELAALKRYPKGKLERYTPYFTIMKHENGNGFDYEVNINKVEAMRKRKGYFLLFSTDMDSSPSEILSYYRAKDIDEKLFAQIKVDMDSARIRTHSTETTDGKVFVTFIACLIRSYILNKLSAYLANNSTSLKKIFNQLSNITVIASNYGLRFSKALSRKQYLILLPFGLEQHIICSL